MPGPVPKHKDERRRRNVYQGETPVYVTGTTEAPELVVDVHPLARRMWDAITKSPVAQFYQETDWIAAGYFCVLMSKTLTDWKPPSSTYSLISQLESRLLLTEGSRRRARLMIERPDEDDSEDEDVPEGVADIADYRKSLEG